MPLNKGFLNREIGITYIVSGSRDRTIRIWDPKTLKQIGILKGHISTVNSLIQFEDKIVSGS